MRTAREALDRLQAGNRRFVAGAHKGVGLDRSRRRQLLQGQSPFATILGCSDSRVPPEFVFDQGLGDLFVVRVAGNIAEDTQIASVVFAVRELGSRLVVVLGHTNCGAVSATLASLTSGGEGGGSELDAVIAQIRPAVASLSEGEASIDRDGLVSEVVRANIRRSVERLRASPTIAHLIEQDGLAVIGAQYALETGVVEFFDDIEIA
ncbi:MAG: carbonic anhydrase [Deltaproteobacteria bacterium]|nr:MAG: carbonic anhydrase [Deltaproteobacteria bacterium]